MAEVTRDIDNLRSFLAIINAETSVFTFRLPVLPTTRRTSRDRKSPAALP
jgi:hypothetical protein